MQVGKYKITRLDTRNLELQELRQVEDKKSGESRLAWTRFGLYPTSKPEVAFRVLAGLLIADEIDISTSVEQLLERVLDAIKGVRSDAD